MSLVNFTEPSLEQLRGILGSYGNEQVGRLVKSTSTYVESRWFKFSDEVSVTEGQDETTEYKASEVLMDGTVVPNGVWFDSDATTSNNPDDPIYFKNLKINAELFTGAVEVGKAYQVEFISPRSYEEETQYYIVPKGGGGASIFRLLCLGDTSIGYNGTSTGFSLIDDEDNITESNVTVGQRKFQSANFYENEILYAQADGVGYDLSPFLAGIGGTSA